MIKRFPSLDFNNSNDLDDTCFSNVASVSLFNAAFGNDFEKVAGESYADETRLFTIGIMGVFVLFFKNG